MHDKLGFVKVDENEKSTKFVKGNEFITNQKLTVNIPTLDPGKYTLVAYVATKEEGIRVTNPIKVKGTFTQVSSNDSKINQAISTNAEGNLILDVIETNDIYKTVNQSFTYETLKETLAEIAYQYGSLPEELVIEEFKDNSWNVLENKTSYSNGQYRLKYEVKDNTYGYVYLTIQ